MLLRATENAVAGHIWPAGTYLPTPALSEHTHYSPAQASRSKSKEQNKALTLITLVVSKR